MHLTITVPTSVYSWGKVIQESIAKSLEDLNGTKGDYKATAPMKFLRNPSEMMERVKQEGSAKMSQHLLRKLKGSITPEIAMTHLKNMGAIDHMSSRTVWSSEVFWVLQHEVGLKSTIRLSSELHEAYSADKIGQAQRQTQLEALCHDCHDPKLALRHLAETWRILIRAGRVPTKVGDLIPAVPQDHFACISAAKVLLKHNLVELVSRTPGSDSTGHPVSGHGQ